MSRELKLIGLGLAVLVAWGCRNGQQPVAEGVGGPETELLDELLAEEPAAEEPAEPTAEAPAEPTAEAPAEPAAEAPAEPTAEAPAEPAAETPAAEEPAAEAPAEPAAEVPAEPVVETPAEPGPYDDLFEKMATEEETPIGRREEAEREFQMGKKLYEDWRYEEALAHFKKAVVAWPKHPEAGKYVERSRAMLHVRLDVQRAHLTDLEAQASRDLQETLFQLQRTVARARSLYERALATQPDDDPTAPRDAIISRQMRDLEESIRLYERAQEVMRWLPYPVDVSRLKAQVAAGAEDARAVVIQREDELTNLRIQKSVEEKAEVRRRMARQEERKIETLVQAARDLYRRGQYDECESMCQKILRLEPNEGRARSLLDRSRATRHALAESKTYYRYELEQDKTMAMIDAATTQYHKVLNYPEDWPEIARRGEVGGFEEAEPEWKRSIRQRLEQKVSFEFMDTPLDQAVDFLREVSQVNIILDPAVVGAAPPRVTLNMRNVPMRLALEWILKLANLQYELKDNAVFISNKSGLRPDLVMRIYDVQDLTITIPDFPGPEFSISATGGAAPPVLGGGGAGLGGGGVAGMTTAAIVDMIKQRVAPASWDAAFGTSIDEKSGKLVVMQTPAVHRLISGLLAKFRSQSKLLVVVESRFLDVREGLFEEIGIDWHDGAGPPPVAPGMIDADRRASLFGDEGRLDTLGTLVGSNVQFAPDGTEIAGGHPYFAGSAGGLNAQITHVGDTQVQALLHALKIRENGLTLTAPRLTVHNGQRAHMFVGTERAYLSGVSVSGDTPDPQISTIMSGVVLDVRPIVSYNRHYITLELRPTIAREGVPSIFNTTFTTIEDIGGVAVATINTFPIEAPSLELTQVRTTVTIPDGGIILIGGLMRDIQYQGENGVPVLSNIPVLGRLFRWNRTDNERANLAVLVTARSLLFEEEEEKL